MSSQNNPMIIETNLSSEYVMDWGVRAELRELIQNCVDAKGKVSVTDTHLILRNENTVLSPQVLFMGIGTKTAGGDTIGQHGEGLKLAMLVAARTGQDITIHNGTKSWRPYLQKNTPGVTVLMIAIENLPADQVSNDFTVKIELPTFPLHEVWLNPDDPACRKPFLSSRRFAGKIYSNGLYVCEINSEYGYNVGHLSLERDRRVSDVWQLRNHIAAIWEEELKTCSQSRALKFAQLLFDGKGVEAEAFNYRTATDEVKTACRAFLVARHPDSIAVRPGSSLKTGSSGLAVSNSFAYGLGDGYWKENEVKTNAEIWWDEYHQQLTEEAQTSLRKLLF